MMTKRFFAAMTIMMALGTATMFASNSTSDRRHPEPRYEIHKVHHTSHCINEMRDTRHRHDHRCKCECHRHVVLAPMPPKGHAPVHPQGHIVTSPRPRR